MPSKKKAKKPAAKAAKVTTKKRPKCGRCRRVGHNTRTCEALI